MRLGPFAFTPTWIPTIATVLILPVLLHLGFWQLNRGAEKAHWQERFDTLKNLDPQPLSGLPDYQPNQRFIQVSVIGRYLNNRQFLLDNRTHQGAAGYHIITPLQKEDGTIVLVNRGWLPVGNSRAELPDINVPTGLRTIDGQVVPAIADAFILGPAGYETPLWPKVVQRLEPSKIETLLNKGTVRTQVVRLSGAETDGYLRAWRAHFGITQERHQGYAFQWFALSIALVAIYFVVNIQRL
ncbi:MAG: SURF1 family protein [Chromatiales bacterium]|jgi:surfeit locus 1 family protein|nr:SURF1 family protein [Chromatiales bacterium]